MMINPEGMLVAMVFNTSKLLSIASPGIIIFTRMGKPGWEIRLLD
jgi:hypothetical protein